MQTLATTFQTSSIADNATLELIEQQIAHNAPALNQLNDEQLQQIAQLVLIERYKAQMNNEIDLHCVDYEKTKNKFIDRRKSTNTKDGYKYAFKDFESYILDTRKLKSPLCCTPSIADDYINNQKLQGKAPATIRRNVSAISSYFSFLERETEYKIKNPFRGTRERPPKENKKQIEKEIPASNLKLFKHDVETIINNEKNAELKAIICCMAYRGLRCGSFEQMSIHGNKFYTESKGKHIDGTLPDICMNAIDKAGLKHNAPFTLWTSNRVKQAIKNHVAKLYNNNFISYKYSAHDMRHFFALCEYTKNKDIYNLSKLLNHSSIAVTELYLKGLKVIE